MEKDSILEMAKYTPFEETQQGGTIADPANVLEGMQIGEQVTFPEDEINVVKSEAVQSAIDNFADADKKTAYAMGLADGVNHAAELNELPGYKLTEDDCRAAVANMEAEGAQPDAEGSVTLHAPFRPVPLEGKAEVGVLYEYKEPESVDPIPTLRETASTMSPQAVLAKSMTIVKELTDNPSIQAALEAQGLTVDVKKLLSDYLVTAGFKPSNDIIRPLTDEEKVQAEGTCACDDCLDETENETDTDTMLIVHDLSERLAKLEQRIADYNVKASHKI